MCTFTFILTQYRPWTDGRRELINQYCALHAQACLRAIKKLRVKQERQKIHIPRTCLPNEISQQCTTATHRSSAPLGGPLGGLPLKDHGCTLGRVAKPRRHVSPMTPVPHSIHKQAATMCLRPLQVDNIFVFIRQVAPVPAC